MSDDSNESRNADTSTRSANGWWRDVSVCMRFLSVYPVRLNQDKQPHLTSGSVRAFGLSGAVLGSISCLTLFIALWLGFNPLLSAILVIAGQIWQTGALHEDGLADVADGFGGGMTQDRKLEIMRDSRIGTYGVIALIIVIGIRIAGLAALIAAMSAATVAAAIVAMSVISRAATGVMMRDLPNARSDGRSAEAGRPDAATVRQLLISSAIVAVPLLVWSMGILHTVLVLAVAWLAVTVMKRKAERHIGGQTGDVLGATQQIVEVAQLLTLAALLK